MCIRDRRESEWERASEGENRMPLSAKLSDMLASFHTQIVSVSKLSYSLTIDPSNWRIGYRPEHTKLIRSAS